LYRKFEACFTQSRGLNFILFEWDDDKNEENIRKPGFDFADAWEIFEAPMRTALDLREDYGEARWNGIGFLGNRVVVVIFTYRGADRIRIISLRKALKYERKRFEEAIGNRLGENRPND
jgi:uncharacterized DUF497 family protein